MSAVAEATHLAPGSVAVLRARFRSGKAQLLAHFASARPTANAAAQLVKALARHVDGLLTALWDEHSLPASAALVAVAGTGVVSCSRIPMSMY